MMFDQLEQLVQQFGQDAVVKNSDVPNTMNDGVMKEASSTIMSGLQGALSNGGVGQLAGLLKGGSSSSVAGNPVVNSITQELVSNLGSKFGLTSPVAQNLATTLIPQVLSTLIENANDPNHKGFELSDIVGAISGGNQAHESGLLSALGGMLEGGNNQQGNSQSGGIGGLLGKIFG